LVVAAIPSGKIPILQTALPGAMYPRYPLGRKRAGAVYAGRRAGHGDAEEVADVAVRQPLDIAQHDHRAVLRRRLVERSGQNLGRRNARGVNSDESVSSAQLRLGRILVHQLLRAAFFMESNGFHGGSSLTARLFRVFPP